MLCFTHFANCWEKFFSTFDIFKNILIYFHFFFRDYFFFHDSFIPLFDRLILYLIYLFSHCYFTHSFNLDFFLFFLHVFSPTRFLFTCRTCSIIYDIWFTQCHVFPRRHKCNSVCQCKIVMEWRTCSYLMLIVISNISNDWKTNYFAYFSQDK